VSKRTSHGGTGFTAHHIRWSCTRFQFPHIESAEKRCVSVYSKSDKRFSKTDISHYSKEQDLEICAVLNVCTAYCTTLDRVIF
jgi:hypothetical protein